MYQKVIFLILFPLFAYSQAPQKINFQSILRNTNGEIVANKSVSLKISIITGSISGSSVYAETHLKTTDVSGLISIQIGNGTVVSGVFANIAWGNAAHFIYLEADFNGGSNYVVLGTQELMSVPYALYASKTDTSVLNLVNRFATKLNTTDTVSLSNRINANVNSNASLSDTSFLNLTSRLATKLNVTDTASLSNRIDTKAPINNPNFTGSVAGISKPMVGLGNVDNTSDAGKPISSATQTALDSKAPINNPTFTGTVGGITKTMVGLGNVDNTTDAGKPISSATQTTLNTKVNYTDTATMLTNYRTGLNSKVNIVDTADMLRPYLRDADTTNMLSTYLRKTDAIITNLQNQVAVLSSYTSLLLSGLVDIDVNNYPVVQIGSQIWMKENLRVSRYRNGDLIPIVTDNTAWGALTTGGRSWYSNDSTTYEYPYGNLYNWYAVVDSRGLCPAGWRVPSDAEWTILTTYLGGESVAGGKMKSVGTAFWNSPNTGATNESGFSALPDGYRFNEGIFYYITYNATFWSVTEYDKNTNVWFRYLLNNNAYVNRLTYPKAVGASVRCLKD